MSIRLSFMIDNPFVKDYNNKTLFWKDIVFAKNKSFEIQLNGYDPKYLIQFGLHWHDSTWDHKGFGIELGLFGFWLDLNIYDHRHAEEPTEEEFLEWDAHRKIYLAETIAREDAKEFRAMEAAKQRKEDKAARDIVNKTEGLRRQAENKLK